MNAWQGTKVKLRAPMLSDFEDYYVKTEEDSESIRNGDRLIFPVGLEARKSRINDLANQNPYDLSYTLIIENEEGKPVGNINSHSCDQINGTFMYGLGVLKAYRGKGYATEAIQLLCQYFFETLDFKKVEVNVYEFNHASIELHKKLGFTQEGILRKSHFALGKRWDVYCFGLLREEFKGVGVK